MRRRAGLFMAALCAVFLFSACAGRLEGYEQKSSGGGTEEENAAGTESTVENWRKTVSVILPSSENESAEELAAIRAKFEGSGYEVAVRVCGSSDERYAAAFEEAVSNKAAGIICDTVRTDDITEAVRAASEAKVPVVLLAKGIAEDELCLAQVTTDMEADIGELAIRFSERLGSNARYMSITQDDNMRSMDMISAFQVGMLDYAGMYEVMTRSVNAVDLSDAESEIREVFLVNPSIEAVVCANSRTTEAMLQAMQTMARSDILVVCVDGDRDGIYSLVEEGKIFGSVARPAAELGDAGADIMLTYLKTRKIPEKERTSLESVLYVHEEG